jgi:hypothetical protein
MDEENSLDYNDLFESTYNEVMSNKPVTAPKKGTPKTQQQSDAGFAGMLGREGSSVYRGENTGYGKSVYDKTLNWDADVDPNDIKGSINEHRYNEQSGWTQMAAGIARVGTKAVTEVLKMPGYLGGAVAAIGAEKNQGWDTAVNNWWIKGLNNFNETTINEGILPVYVGKAIKEGNLWDNISSTSFWATEGADGAGFIASMFVPGAIFKSIGLGQKIMGATAKTLELASGEQKVSNAVRMLSKLGIKTPEQFDVAGTAIANTFAESAAEAGGAIDNFEKTKDQFFENYSNIKLAELKQIDDRRKRGEIDVNEANRLSQEINNKSPEDAFNEQKGRLGRNIFLSNLAILAVPNLVQSKMIWGKAGAKALNTEVPSLLGKIANRGKNVGGALVSEGFVEEASQSTVENLFTDKAKRGELSSSGITNDFNLGELGKEYINTVSSTDGQKAIFLGGFFGGTMGAYAGAKQDIQDRKVSNTLLGLAKNGVNHFNSVVEKDVYQRDESGNIVYENNKPQYDPVKVKEMASSLNSIEQMSDEFNEAVERGDDDAVKRIKDQAVNELIAPFISQGEVGLQALRQHLSETSKAEDIQANDKNKDSQKFIESTMKKAADMQKRYETYKGFSKPLINLKNDSAEKNDFIDYYNSLADLYVAKEGERHDIKEDLKDLYNKKNELLRQLDNDETISRELNENYIEGVTEELYKNVKNYDDPRLQLLQDKITEQEKNLKEVDELIDKDLWDSKKVNESFDVFVKDRNELRETMKKVKEVQELLDKVESAQTLKDLEDLKTDNPAIQDKINRKKALLEVQKEAKKENTKESSKNRSIKNKTELSDQFDYIADEFDEGDVISLDEDNNYFGLPKDKVSGKEFTVSKVNKETKNITIKDKDGKLSLTINFDTLVKNLSHNPEGSFSTEGGMNSKTVQTSEKEKVPTPKEIVHDSVDAKVITIDPATDERYPWVSEAAEEYERLPQDKTGRNVEFQINDGNIVKTPTTAVPTENEIKLNELQNLTGVTNRAFSKSVLEEFDIPIDKKYDYASDITVDEFFKSKLYLDNKPRIEDRLSVYDLSKDDIESVELHPMYSEGRSWFQLNALSKGNNYIVGSIPVELSEKSTKLGLAKELASKEYSDFYKKSKETEPTTPTTSTTTQKDTSNFKEEWLQALEMIKNKDFSNLEFLIKHLPINVVFNNGGIASLESHDARFEDKFNRTTRNIREAIVMELAKGTPISAITTTIAGQNNGQIQVEDTVLENSLLDLYEISGNKDRITLDNLYIVDDLGNLLNGKGQKWAASRKLAKGEIYLKIHTANGTPFPLKLNVQRVNNLQAEALYYLYQYRFDDIGSKTKSTLLINTSDQVQDIIKSNLSKELELFKANGKSFEDLTIKDVIDFLIWDGSKSPKSQIRFYDSKLLVGNKEYTDDEFGSDESKESFIRLLTEKVDDNNRGKRQHIRFKDKKGGIKSLTIDNPNRLYLDYLLQNNILNTNAKVNQPTFKGNTSIYLTPDAVQVNGKLSEFNKKIKRNLFKEVIGKIDGFTKKYSDLFKLRLKLTDDESNYVDRYNKEYDRVSTLKGGDTESLSKTQSKRNTAKRGNVIDLVFRDFFMDTNNHNLDKFVEMFQNNLNNVNKRFGETNEMEFGEEVIVKLFDTLNSYAQYFKDKNWKIYSQGFTVGGRIGNLGTNEGRFAGTTDIIAENEIGELFIIDLKTSTIDRTNLKTYNEEGTVEDRYEYAEKDKIQLNTYAYLAEQSAPNANIQGLFILPIQIKADEKSTNSKYTDPNNISSFNEDMPLLEVEYEKGAFHEVLGVTEDSLKIKKESTYRKKTGKFDTSNVSKEEDSFTERIEELEEGKFELAGFLESFEQTPKKPAAKSTKKEDTFSVQEIIDNNPEDYDVEEFDFSKNEGAYSSNYVELNGEKYYFNTKGPKASRFFIAKKTSKGYDLNVDLTLSELEQIKKKIVSIALDQKFTESSLNKIWNSRLNSVSLPKASTNKTQPSQKEVVKKEPIPAKKVVAAKKEEMKVNTINFDKLTDKEASSALAKLSNAYIKEFKTTISKINVRVRGNKNYKQGLKELVTFLEGQEISREAIETKCK